jgi:hypothetical protein
MTGVLTYAQWAVLEPMMRPAVRTARPASRPVPDHRGDHLALPEWSEVAEFACRVRTPFRSSDLNAFGDG